MRRRFWETPRMMWLESLEYSVNRERVWRRE
jgi:hypothetical protein